MSNLLETQHGSFRRVLKMTKAILSLVALILEIIHF
jgi:hypothetical protein